VFNNEIFTEFLKLLSLETMCDKVPHQPSTKGFTSFYVLDFHSRKVSRKAVID